MKIEIDNNKLHEVCGYYGLDINKALYYTNVVVIPGTSLSSGCYVYVTLDKDCNVIGVRDYDDKFGGKYNYFEGVYDIFNDDIISDLMLDYDGDIESAISPGTIIKITDKYSKWYTGRIDSSLSDNQLDLVNYMTFLRNIMNRYFVQCYQMKTLGYDFPSLKDYMCSIVSNINDYVKNCVDNNMRPDAYKYISFMGQGQGISFAADENDLNDAMRLLTKCNYDEFVSLDDLIIQMKDMVNEDIIKEKPIQKKKEKKHY